VTNGKKRGRLQRRRRARRDNARKFHRGREGNDENFNAIFYWN
jgi:hypothetical protein